MSPPDAASPPRPRPAPARRLLRLAFQVACFGAGLSLLWWCGTIALRPENRESLARLAGAPARSIAALVLLTTATMLVNGAVFRESIRPVRRLPGLEVQAVNVTAMLLSYLPFKVSILFRVLVHNRRHGVPLLTIGAWLGAISAVMAAVAGPLVLVSLWRQRVDAAWLALTLGGVAACVGTLLGIATVLASERGWAVIESAWARLPGLRARRTLLERAHEGVRMLGHPGAVLLGAALRLTDAAVNAARFIVAASILGFPLTWEQGVLAGAVYSLAGAAAPAGQLGTREAATAGFLAGVLAVDRDGLVVVVLLVTAVEAAVLLLGAALSAAYLRPDLLLRPTPSEPRP